MATTTTQHMNARGDMDLISRFIAKAEMMGLENPQGLIHNNMAKLVATVVDSDQTVANVHAYAYETRESYIAATPPPAGANLAAVNDSFLEIAINALLAEQTPVTP